MRDFLGFEPMMDEGGNGGTGNPGAGGGGESSAIQQMRAQLDTMKADLDVEKANSLKLQEDLAAKDTELKSFLEKDMSEQEKLKGQIAKANDELNELRPLKASHAEADKTFEALYEKRLADVPDDKKESAKVLTGDGSWASRFQKLDTLAKDFVVTKAPAPGATNPSNNGVPPTQTNTGKQHDLRESGNTGWDAILSAKRGS